MYKILIHLGLPKTATTTLQKNIFKKLHKQNEINFLPKSITVDSRLDFTKDEFENFLVKDKLNVISRESLVDSYHNDWLIVLDRLNNLINDYDTSIFITLRNPKDYIHSYYVETYPSLFSMIKEANTLEKFIEYISKKENKEKFKAFNYSDLLELLKNKLGKINILLYEDLLYDDDEFFTQLSNLVGKDKTFIKENFSSKKQNVKKSLSNGKYSRRRTLSEVLQIKALKKEKNIMYKILKYSLLNELIRFIDKKILKSSSKGQLHKNFNDSENSKLDKEFLCDNVKLHTKYALSLEKLKKYKYL